jgi:hypothetical protein
MKLLSSHIFRAAAVALAIPFIGISATSTVNVTGGTVTYAPGTGTTGTFSQAIFAGSDEYFLSATYTLGASASGGTYFDFVPTVTYIGASPSATADTINFNLLGSIYDSAASNWDGTYSEHIPFVNSAGVTGTGELFVDGQGVGAVSKGAGSYPATTVSALLTGLSGPTLSEAFDYSFSFAAGSADLTAGSSPFVSSATPEPATIIPAALSLAGFALVAIRRRKQ